MINPEQPCPRAAIVAPFPPLIGGVSIHSELLSNRLSENGWAIKRIPTDFDPKDQSPFLWGLSLLKILSRTLTAAAQGVRVFHFHTSYNAVPFLVCAPFLKLLKAKIVLSIHAGDYIEEIRSKKGLFYLHKYYFKIADGIIVMNPAQCIKLRHTFNLSQTVTAASPYIADKRSAPPRRFDNEEDYSGTLKVGVVGQWDPMYRLEDAIHVLRSVCAAQAQTRFNLYLIVATGVLDSAYRNQILQLVSAANSSRLNVKIYEDLPHEEMAGFYTFIDLFVRPSEVDSYGLCVTEALHAGTPVVATDVCPRPKTVRTYAPGNLAGLKDLIIETAHRLKTQSTDRADMFSAPEDGYPIIETTLRTLSARCALPDSTQR